MPGLQEQLDESVRRLRRAATVLQDIEVKAGAGGLPKTAVETISAFANADGGLLVLGLDESSGFAAVAIDAPKLAADLASACSSQLEPPIRPELDVATIDGQPVVVALVDSLPAARKPCFVTSIVAHSFAPTTVIVRSQPTKSISSSRRRVSPPTM